MSGETLTAPLRQPALPTNQVIPKDQMTQGNPAAARNEITSQRVQEFLSLCSPPICLDVAPPFTKGLGTAREASHPEPARIQSKHKGSPKPTSHPPESENQETGFKERPKKHNEASQTNTAESKGTKTGLTALESRSFRNKAHGRGAVKFKGIPKGKGGGGREKEKSFLKIEQSWLFLGRPRPLRQ